MPLSFMLHCPTSLCALYPFGFLAFSSKLIRVPVCLAHSAGPTICILFGFQKLKQKSLP